MPKSASRWFGPAVAAAVLACEAPSDPVRLAPYEFRLFGSDTVFHWTPDHLPVRFYAEPAGRLPTYVDLGIRRWERQFLYGEFRGVVVTDSTTADVIVELQGDPPPDVPLSDAPARIACEGVTAVPPIRGDSIEGFRFDQHLRITMWWFADETPQDVVNCLARVTAHEIGHALGVFAHSPHVEDLMYQRPEVPGPSLRDRATIQILYHTPSDVTPYRP
jgi:hypothetical protein